MVGEVVVHCLGKTFHENNSPHPLFSGRQGSHISRCRRPVPSLFARTPKNIFHPPDLSRSHNLRSPERFQWLRGKHLPWDLAHIFSCSRSRLFADLERECHRGVCFNRNGECFCIPSFSSQNLFPNLSFEQTRVVTIKPAWKSVHAGFFSSLSHLCAKVWADEVAGAPVWHILPRLTA